MVDSQTWPDRFKMAFASSIGYVLGAITVYAGNI